MVARGSVRSMMQRILIYFVQSGSLSKIFHNLNLDCLETRL